MLADVGDDAQLQSAEARVRAAFAEPFMLGDLEVSIRASVGRSVWPDDGRSVTVLLSHADAAMYQDKASARCPPAAPSQGRPLTNAVG